MLNMRYLFYYSFSLLCRWKRRELFPRIILSPYIIYLLHYFSCMLKWIPDPCLLAGSVYTITSVIATIQHLSKRLSLAVRLKFFVFWLLLSKLLRWNTLLVCCRGMKMIRSIIQAINFLKVIYTNPILNSP